MEENSTVCHSCGKKQPEKENQLVDWLVSHTKGKIQDDAESSIYEAIKNFLLSHIYGTVVSLTLVAAVGVTVYANPSYVTKTTSEKFNNPAPQQTEKPQEQEENVISQVVSASDNAEIQSVGRTYMRNINYLGEVNAEGETIGTEDLAYWYQGYDGYREVGGADHRAGALGTVSVETYVYQPVTDPAYFVLDATKNMYNDGIPVAECYAEEFMTDKETGDTVLYRRTMYSFTKSEKGWCIYEDRVEQLIEYNVISFTEGYYDIDDWKNAANSNNPSVEERVTGEY